MAIIASERDRYSGLQSTATRRTLRDVSSSARNERGSIPQAIKTSILWGGTAVGFLAVGLGLRNIQNLFVEPQDTSNFNPNTGQEPYGYSGQQSSDNTALGAAATMVLQSAKDTYNANHPSPTPTETPRPTATSSPDPASKSDFLGSGTMVPGKIYRVPYPPPPTPTPYLSCLNMDQLSPGDWCIWPTSTSDNTGDATPQEFGIVLSPTPGTPLADTHSS